MSRLPGKRAIELPLLRALIQLGGQARPQDVYPLVTKAFPHLTEADLAQQLPSGGNKWKNRIHWTRQDLVDRGEMANPSWGVWAITDKGRQRVLAADRGEPWAEAGGSADTDGGQAVSNGSPPTPVDLLELYDQYEAAFKRAILSRLHDLEPAQFENFARKLLEAYGFTETVVTQVSRDGGIDGHGRLKVGLAMMNVAFQCKRWQGPVGRPEIDKFRGAIQGEFEQGIFFTTSDFTTEAREASIKKGAVPIVLLNGEAIVDLMIEKDFGIRRRPLTLYTDALDELFTDLDGRPKRG